MKLRSILEMDFLLLLCAITITIFGILFIYSSAMSSSGMITSTEYSRQIIWGAGGLVAALIIACIDYRKLRGITIWAYGAILLLLLYTILFGQDVHSTRAWIGIGGFGIQPSEFAKITTILFLARYLDDTKKNPTKFSRFLVSCVIVLIPMGLILIQPDFGTSLVFIPILLVMTFIAGISVRYVIFLIAFIGLTVFTMLLPLWQTYILHNSLSTFMLLTDIRFVGLSTLTLGVIAGIALLGLLKYKKRYFYWILYGAAIVVLSLGASFAGRKILKEYQIMRLIVFLDPEVDPRGAGWHIIQSITAIGSGGLNGKGYLQGTQSHYRFLPEQSTDFIFSIFSEEWGFSGGVTVFALFLFICLRLVRIMKLSSDGFGIYISAGLAAMYIFHFLVNVGMTMGIMPITGIPLFFMSYGGSSLIAAMVGIGLALSIHIRKYER
ncbi:rod shape-determining protein RodA [Spirochaetia bacterium]|nr:rod shape-determining protein RodA [Spirochaetia bacterium]